MVRTSRIYDEEDEIKKVLRLFCVGGDWPEVGRRTVGGAAAR